MILPGHCIFERREHISTHTGSNLLFHCTIWSIDDELVFFHWKWQSTEVEICSSHFEKSFSLSNYLSLVCCALPIRLHGCLNRPQDRLLWLKTTIESGRNMLIPFEQIILWENLSRCSLLSTLDSIARFDQPMTSSSSSIENDDRKRSKHTHSIRRNPSLAWSISF
jgi:hypothetical protein